MKQKSIIITGVRGFVGQNLEKFFKNKFSIFGISRTKCHDENRYIYEQLNQIFIDDDSFAVLHLAGKAHDLKKTSQDSEYYQVNTELTKTLFNQFLESSCEVFIYMSSVKAARAVVEEELTEDTTPNPFTVYGKSKLAAESYILSKEIPEGKRVYILRPCMIHGPNNKGNMDLLYLLVSKGIPYPFGKFKNQRSFLSVENLCFVINELLENPGIPSGIYNIADDEPISTVELVKIIGDSLGKKVNIFNLSPDLIKKIAKIGDYLPILLNSEKLEKLTESYVVSNNKIKEVIKKELPLSTVEGLKKTFKNYDKN